MIERPGPCPGLDALLARTHSFFPPAEPCDRCLCAAPGILVAGGCGFRASFRPPGVPGGTSYASTRTPASSPWCSCSLPSSPRSPWSRTGAQVSPGRPGGARGTRHDRPRPGVGLYRIGCVAGRPVSWPGAGSRRVALHRGVSERNGGDDRRRLRPRLSPVLPSPGDSTPPRGFTRS